MKNPLLLGLIALVLFCTSCSKDEDPAPATGALSVTVTDPDGAAAAGAQIQFFASESDAVSNQNVVSTFTGNAQGVVNVDITVGSYHARIVSSDNLLLDVIAPIQIAASNNSRTIELSWDASAYVVGGWDVTGVDVEIDTDSDGVTDTAPDGANYDFAGNGTYKLFSNTTEILSDSWEIDADNSLIRISGTKIIVESYLLDDLGLNASVPNADVADVETYAVTTNSRNMVTLMSAGVFTADGTEVTYSLNFQMTRK